MTVPDEEGSPVMAATDRKAVGRGMIIIALTMSMLAAVPAAALAHGPDDPFHGSYRGIDTAFDDSSMLIAFGGPDAPRGPSDIRRVVWLDDLGVFCEGDRLFAEGVGYVDGNTILVVIEYYCGNAGNLAGEDVVEFTSDPAGTLTDSYGNVWSRP